MTISELQHHHHQQQVRRSWLQRALNIQEANCIGFWPFNETTGTVAYDISGNGRNGAYTGVTLANGSGPGGLVCPYYDGITSYADLYSAGLAGAFSGAKGALAGWFQVNDATVWAALTLRYMCYLETPAINTRITLAKLNVANSINFYVRLGAATQQLSVAGFTSLAPIPYVINYADSANGNRAELFANGVSVASFIGGFGAWDGVPPVALLTVGAKSTAPVNVWYGWIPPFAMYAGVNFSAADIAAWSTEP